MTNPSLNPGDRLGHHTIVRHVSTGGSGEVYLARDDNLTREVAIKVLLPHLSGEPDAVDRFLREAREMAKMQHPNIAQVYEVQVDKTRNLYYFAMEYLPNGTLADWMRRRAERGVPFDESRILAVAREILEGLAYAHGRGRMHRDLKPANIMRAADGRFKIADFGLAKRLERGADQSGIGMFGSPRYMSPEQANGQPQDQRSDLYSFGVVLFEMLGGRPPFDAGNTTQLLIQHIRELPPDLRRLNRRVSAGTARLVGRLLAKRPQDRPASAEAVLAALKRLPSRGIEIRPAAALAGGLATVALLAGAGYLYVTGGLPFPAPSGPGIAATATRPAGPTAAPKPATGQGGLNAGAGGPAATQTSDAPTAAPGSPTVTIVIPTSTPTPRPLTPTPVTTTAPPTFTPRP